MTLATSTIDQRILEATFVGQPDWDDSDPDCEFEITRPKLNGIPIAEKPTESWRDAPGALLRQRLLAAAVVLGGCLILLFLRSWWLGDSVWAVVRGLILVHIVGCLVVLSGRRILSIAELRGFELAIFVPVGIQIYSFQLRTLLEAAVAHDVMRVSEVIQVATFGFALLMMAYGMFMPNGWHRTAVMLIPPTLAPLSIVASGLWFQPWLREIFTSFKVLEVAMIPCISAMVAAYGTQAIATLRHEANKARRLGQYRLTRELGRGGMGQVFLAEHQLLKRPCAVKVIHPQHVIDPNALARFEREVRTTARLSHWHTVEVYDYGHTEDGTFYYVMEYLPGMNLGELVSRFGPLPISRAVHFLRQTCAALREAHHEGMIHRDLKPANIYAAERGGVYDVTKLLDFGLVADRRQSSLLAMQSSDVVPLFAGSPLYMSPEQARGSGLIDARSDIYSLGAVGYYLMTGRPPFDGQSPWRVMVAHIHDQVIPPSRFRPDLPSDLEAVLMKCLEKRPENRFPDVASLADALANCATGRIWTFKDAEDWWATHVTTCEL